MSRVYRLTDSDLPENLWRLRDIFLALPEPSKYEGKGLHEVFMAKGLKCFCPKCKPPKVQRKLL